jgi:hypothetical protein
LNIGWGGTCTRRKPFHGESGASVGNGHLQSDAVSKEMAARLPASSSRAVPAVELARATRPGPCSHRLPRGSQSRKSTSPIAVLPARARSGMEDAANQSGITTRGHTPESRAAVSFHFFFKKY